MGDWIDGQPVDTDENGKYIRVYSMIVNKLIHYIYESFPEGLDTLVDNAAQTVILFVPVQKDKRLFISFFLII